MATLKNNLPIEIKVKGKINGKLIDKSLIHFSKQELAEYYKTLDDITRDKYFEKPTPKKKVKNDTVQEEAKQEANEQGTE